MTQPPRHPAQPVVNAPILSFAEADTLAFIRLAPGRVWEPGPLLELLAASGIVYGFDERLFFEALAAPDGEPHPVAVGCPPMNGADGRVTLAFVDAERLRGQPHELPDGRADLRELGLVDTVQAGAVIARRTPPGAGIPGRNVFGEPMPAKPGKLAPLLAGRNTMLSEDGDCLWSLIDGEPYVEGGRIAVRPVLQIRGDVDYATGNIDFDGSVRVAGDVRPGFSIRAGASVEVGGVVEGGTIEAGERVVVEGGVRGGATIRARGDVVVAYVDARSTIATGSDLRVMRSASHSCLSAALAIRVGGKLVGGSAHAGEMIAAGEIGTMAEVPTYIGIRRALSYVEIDRLGAEAARLERLSPSEATSRRLRHLAAELAWRRERAQAADAMTLLYVQKQVHGGVRFEVDGAWCEAEDVTAVAPAPAGRRA